MTAQRRPLRRWAGATSTPFWLDRLPDDPAAPPLRTAASAGLAIVGGGFTGLWAALLAKQADPARDVVLLEGRTCGWAASGRNGGFCSSSRTHGLANGQARWPEELDLLEQLGRDNLAELVDDVHRLGIDCDLETTGELTVAVAPWQLEGLEEDAELARRTGHKAELLDADGVRQLVDSPTYLGGLFLPGATVMLDPGKLAAGLRRACLQAGVRLYEHTPVTGVRSARGDSRVVVETREGSVLAERVLLATNAFPSPLRRLRLLTVPVYDYVLVTEPLSPAQLDSVGWRGRQGISDAGNLFHYYRLTDDNRILWGGYDAVYHPGSRVGPAYDQRPATFDALADHFAETFPTLADVAFTHAWGGAIDTSTRFCASAGTALRGHLAWVLGFTGLGVGATRFMAATALDLLDGVDSERTRLRMVREKAVPFPPEPVRSLGIAATQWSLRQSDAHGGRRNLWLRTLDRLGLGFDS
ncbi:MAG: NAD(P)/FAD-dependent oxidoreductase [Actinomycetales bacterium]